MLGEKLKKLRESKGLVQRQIAPELSVDTAYISKIENDEKPLQRSHIPILSQKYGISENELLSLWLSEKIISLVKDEPLAIESLKLSLNFFKKNKIDKNESKGSRKF